MSMTISTKDIAELRARTGAGMMDCKKALEEADGNMERAGEILRRKGIAKAEKRAGRTAAQGVIFVAHADNHRDAAMIELTSETDFVARNDAFRQFAGSLTRFLLAMPPQTTLAGFLAHAPDDGDATVDQLVKETSGKTGEAVGLARIARFGTESGTIGLYRHFNDQVAVLVEVSGEPGAALQALADAVALHVASADPIAVRTEDIPVELLERERRIAEEQVAAEGKPEAIRGKIVEGKVRKFASERALVEQAFIKDESRTVGQLLADVPGARIQRFARFKVGEAG
jgi:elongation factor Ts